MIDSILEMLGDFLEFVIVFIQGIVICVMCMLGALISLAIVLGIVDLVVGGI